MDDLKIYAGTSAQLTSLINTSQVLLKGIGLELGPAKCAGVNIKRGKQTTEGDLELMDGSKIHELTNGETYKYLGIIEANDIKSVQARQAIRQQYIQRVKKILQSQLNGENKIRAINTWAVPVIRYGAGIISWTKEEISALDIKTRKLMTLNHMLHPRFLSTEYT